MKKILTILLALCCIVGIDARAKVTHELQGPQGSHEFQGEKGPKGPGPQGSKDSKKAKKVKKSKKAEKPKKIVTKTIYVYGVGYNPVDSIVYFTDEQQLDSMQIEKKTKFLEKRAMLSQELKNYLQSIGEKKCVCAIIYSTSLKKLDSMYLKQAKKYKKDGYFIKPADKSQFSFFK